MVPAIPAETLLGSAQMLFWLLTVLCSLASCLWFVRMS
jgi:hypothetical protein